MNASKNYFIDALHYEALELDLAYDLRKWIFGDSLNFNSINSDDFETFLIPF